MVKILIVEKTGNIKAVSFNGNTVEELAKKAGHKTATDFELAETWNITIDDVDYSVSLFGKVTGRANQENKYEFPPPIDTQLFFGSCVLVRNATKTSVANQWIDLTEDEWSTMYDYLYGGFDDLYDTETEEDEEDDVIGGKTKEGYKKDSFVVEDEDEEVLDDIDEPPISRKKHSKKAKTVVYENCQGEDELVEEEYI
jgi:hypothetical protein